MNLRELLWNVYVPSRVNLSTGGAKQLEFVINSYARFLDREPTLDDLNELQLQQWVAHGFTALKRVTVSRQRSRLVTLWRFAYRKKLVSAEPPELEPIRLPKRIPVAWTMEDLEKILHQCRLLRGTMRDLRIRRADWWLSLTLWLYDTGSRINAALCLRSCDVDLAKRACLLRAESSKTWLEQVLPISPQTADAIATIFDESRPLVWPYPWHRRRLWRELKQLLADAGVDASAYVGFHRLRRTHATQAVRSAGWEAAARDLGHTSVRMTQQYVDLRQIDHQDVSLPRPRLA